MGFYNNPNKDFDKRIFFFLIIFFFLVLLTFVVLFWYSISK